MRRDALPTPLIGAVAFGAAGVGFVLAATTGAGSADAWSGPLVIAAAVLVISGGAKLADPRAVADALDAIAAPSSAGVVALIAAGEIAVGTFAVLAGGRLAAGAIAAVYLAFAAVAWRMSRSEGVRSCGCFGSSGARPGPLHIVVDVAVAVLAGAAAVTGSGGLVSLVADTPGAGIPAAAAILTGIAALIAVLTVAAEALDAATPAPTRTDFHLVEAPR